MEGEVLTEGEDFEATAVRCHEIISRVKNSQTRIGMHTFGDIPQSGDRAEMINTILRFDSSSDINTRRLVFDFVGRRHWGCPQSTGVAGPLRQDIQPAAV